MNQCLNPDCLAVNLETHRFCQQCGQKLWLKDRYQALKLIGQGGFGKTFLAIDHDKPSKPQCVIKQFFPQGQGTSGLQKAAELFAEEAKRLDELGKHPQIPELLAYFIHEDKRQYLVQEYIEGQNLEQELKSQGNFNQDKIRALLLDLLPVLDFIHQRQVIHRDIKPENIIRRAQDNKLVLVDFGAAKAVTPVNRSVTGTMIGSAEYVAPEQMNGKAVNASDLYSLGVTCLYLLTGISPFDLFDVGEHEWIWRDYLVNNSVSDDLGNILDKLVIFGTKRRYQDVKDVLGDLELKTITQIQVPSPILTIPASPRPSVSSSQALIETLPGGIKLEMVMLPAGSFMMGSDDYDDEKPRHQVTLKEFAIGKYPVTQEQYQAIMGNNTSHFKNNPTNPVEEVSWNDSQAFCQKINQKTGKKYRLPSEAEWEYACRAGTQTRYYFGDNEKQLGEYAWYSENSGSKTHPVGQKKPNDWGLYDMSGNVREWCGDSWHDNYKKAPTDGSSWNDNHSESSPRTLRGGSWYDNSRYCRSANRIRCLADVRYYDIGFRVVCAVRGSV
ncbi:MAG: serine/threonine protein kinase [Snowella sp.]|nr:MAG: serine/threonine protein kinase [Snowella sp.]